MTNITERNEYTAAVRMIEPGDSVIGGPNAPINLPFTALANRTLWLKNEITKAVAQIGQYKTTADQGLAAKTDKTTTISAGAGLTGGGNLSANRSIALATPATLNGSTSNWAGNGSTGHTHELAKATATVAGVAKLINALNSTADDAALSAAQGKVLSERIAAAVAGSLPLKGTLGNRNLNDLKGEANYGVWHQSGHAGATTGLNYPVQKAGTLLVLPSAHTGQQVYIPLDNKAVYIRQVGSNGNFGAWFSIGETMTGLELSSALRINAVNAWNKIDMLTKSGGKFVLETNINAALATPENIRLSMRYSEGSTSKYLWFPSFSNGETVAYQSWVGEQINGKTRFARPQVKSGSAAVTLDLASRAGIIAAMGADYIPNGCNQLILHNNSISTISGLPINDKSAIQLDFYLMGAYSFVDCHYPLLNRSFCSRLDWNNEAQNLHWVEHGTANNSVMLTGNQTVAGNKTFSGGINAHGGIAFSQSAALAGQGTLGSMAANANETWIRNHTSNKYLKLANSGELTYDNQKVWLYNDRSDAVNLNDTNKIATAKAVKTAYDKAAEALQTAQTAISSGAVMYFAQTAAPAGWLAANGAAVSRTTYADLFRAIGTTYGAGNGQTTFNLPDLRSVAVSDRGVDLNNVNVSPRLKAALLACIKI